MNRSILIVICDFLLVSLLAFSTVDIDKMTDQTSARAVSPDTASAAPTNRIGGRDDLGDVMRLALEEEHKKQEALASELSKTRAAAGQQEALLNQREGQLQNFQQQLRAKEEQAERLEAQQSNLLGQVTAAQNNLAGLNQQLQASAAEIQLTKEQRAEQEAALREQTEAAAALQQQLSALQAKNQAVAAEREQLAGQLRLTEVEKQAATTQLARTEEDLALQRQQNANLAEGVKELAGKSVELAKEIHESRPLTPNTIFNEFTTNRVTVTFDGARPGIFGAPTAKDKQTQTILAGDGTNTFALCHLQETLLTLIDPGSPWRGLTGKMGRGPAEFPVGWLSFYQADPRVALMPVSPASVRALGCKVYRLSSDPYKYQDAVVVGAREGYYGVCQFQMDLTTPAYLKMDHNSLKGLFGKFNPSTGDLVFSENGELLGVMVNGAYCVIIRNFAAAATIRFGSDLRKQDVAPVLSALNTTVAGLPFKLQ